MVVHSFSSRAQEVEKDISPKLEAILVYIVSSKLTGATDHVSKNNNTTQQHQIAKRHERACDQDWPIISLCAHICK